MDVVAVAIPFPPPDSIISQGILSCLDSRLRPTEFAALLARADVSQAAFARLTGVTPRQVNNWCRGRAAVPAWAALVAVLLDDHSPEALTIRPEEARQTLAAAEPAQPR